MTILLQKSNQPTEAERRATQIKQLVTQFADLSIRSWHNIFDTLWGGADTQEILDALGDDATELFELNDIFIVFAESVLVGKRQDDLDQIKAKLALKPPTTINDEGLVKITE